MKLTKADIDNAVEELKKSVNTSSNEQILYRHNEVKWLIGTLEETLKENQRLKQQVDVLREAHQRILETYNSDRAPRAMGSFSWRNRDIVIPSISRDTLAKCDEIGGCDAANR